MSARPNLPEDSPQAMARAAFRGAAADRTVLGHAVVRFHRKLDEVLEVSHRAHGVQAACRRGCSMCCHMPVQVLPPEAFALADWLRRNRTAAQLEAVLARLRDNARRTRELGAAARQRSNLPCALLGEDGACTAYEARPAQCRQFHSTDLATCEASYAAPADDSILSPAHPLVAHNAQVLVTLARHGLRDEGLDDEPRDMNFALLAALEESKAWRRWRDGKKAIAAVVRAWGLLWPAALAVTFAFEDD